jgi:hypothetical protein
LSAQPSTVSAATSEPLWRWLLWLHEHAGAQRILDCPCLYAWKSLGILYGMSMGDGWVRMTTDPDCPEHGAGAQ